MRKPLVLLGAAALAVALVIWWMSRNFAVALVPGWHVPILSPYQGLILLVVAAVVFLAIAMLITRWMDRPRT